MSDRKSLYFYLFSVVAIYALIYIPAYYVPMHNDDYGYYLLGTGLDAHLRHYMGWSGRFITDYTSSLLLNLFSRLVYMAINSLAFLVMVINMSLIPTIISRVKLVSAKSAVCLWVAFMLYWLNNPNLGQTSFWLVGSANYLWPLMWTSLYLTVLFYTLESESSSNLRLFLIGILGFLAGFSNEATGVSIVFLTFILFFIYKNKRKVICVAFVVTLIGFLFLFLAPGNYARLDAYEADYADWFNASLIDKILNYVLREMPDAMFASWLGLTVIVYLLFFILRADYKIKSNLKFYLLVATFFVVAIFSLLVFVKSPIMPSRAENTFNFFIVITATICLYELLSVHDKSKNLLVGLLFFVLASCFALSWARFAYASMQVSVQNQIMEEIILKAKEQNLKELKVPEYFFTKLNKEKDKFNIHRAGPNYGLRFVWSPIDFNYAILKTKKPLDIYLDGSDFKPSAVYYNNGDLDNGYKIFDENRLVFEFDEPIYAKTKDKIAIIHIDADGHKSIDYRCDFTQIFDKYYCAVTLNKIRLKHIGVFNFALYEKQDSFSIDFKGFTENGWHSNLN